MGTGSDATERVPLKVDRARPGGTTAVSSAFAMPDRDASRTRQRASLCKCQSVFICTDYPNCPHGTYILQKLKARYLTSATQVPGGFFVSAGHAVRSEYLDFQSL